MNKKYVQLEESPLKINQMIDRALEAPFPTIAIHHLIDRLFECYEPDPNNPQFLKRKSATQTTPIV